MLRGVTAGDDGVFVSKKEACDFPTAPALGGVFSGPGGLFLGSCQLSASTILRAVQTAPLPPWQPRGLQEKVSCNLRVRGFQLLVKALLKQKPACETLLQLFSFFFLYLLFLKLRGMKRGK